MDGLRLVHATVSAPFKRWQQEVPEGLTSVERETIAKAQQETEAWLDAVKKAEAAEAAKARPAGSQSRTGYSRTALFTSEEEIAGAAGRTRRPRPGAIDRGKGARPRYANDPVRPKVPGVPEQRAILPGGESIPPDSYSGGFHGTKEPPEQVMKSGLPARGNNWDLHNHAEELWHYEPASQQVNDSAFRGTSSVPSDPANESGAAYFAGEGGYVYEIRRVPTWDVNKALQGRVGQTGSIRGNLMHGEGEYAIPARVTPDKIKRWGVVKSNSRGQLYVEWHEGSPAAPAQPAAKTSPQADVEDTSIKGGGKSQPGPRATEPQREMEEDPKAGRTPVSAKSREEAAEDLKRIRQLEAWDQQGKLTGDVGG
jgi:hypothetical protein